MSKRKFELDLASRAAGRPTKSREIRTADGTLLLEKDEFQKLEDCLVYIQEQYLTVKDIWKKTIERYYILGQLLETMNRRLGRRIPKWWITEKIGLSRHTIDTARKVYANKSEYIDENGKARIGVNLFPKNDNPKQERARVEFPLQKPDRERVSNLPQKAGLQLKRHRIRAEPTDGQFYVYHNDDAPYPVIRLSVDVPRNFLQETAFEKLRDEIQVSLEKYYNVIEQTEDDYT